MKTIYRAMLHALLMISVALASLAATPWARLLAAERGLQRVNVAYSSISGNNATLWVTQEKGFFRKHGLDVQVVLIESGSTTAQALISGDISFAHMAGAAVLQNNLRGADAVIIAGVVNTLIFQLYTDKGITRPDQLRGKAVGVTRFGSSTDFAMRYALERYGLEPGKDVTIMQMGNVPAILAALEAGKLQGAMLSPPTTLRAKKAGFPVLADLQMLGLEYQHTSVATTRALIKSRPELVRDFMRAYVEGIHYAKTHRDETLEILAKYLRNADREVLEETYENIVLTLVPEKPYPTLKGIQVMLREIGAKDPAARAAKPEQFVDMTFVKELDASGFVDRLYKSQSLAKAGPSKAQPAQPPAQASKQAPPPPARVEPAPVPPAAGTAGPIAGAKTQPADERPSVAPKTERSEPAPSAVPPAAPQPVAAMAAGGTSYVVEPGDYLSRIALKFYNSSHKWAKIYEANRDTLKNPNYIYIGQVLIIPPDDGR